MVGDREGGARARVEDLAPVLLGADRNEAGLAQGAVDVHRLAGRRRDAVLGHDDHLAPARLRGVDQLAAHGVELAQIPLQARMREIGPEALQVVVEVREVGEGERGAAGAHHVQGRLRDPLRGADVGERPPESEEREGPELRVELRVKSRGMRVVVRDLAPVGRVHRPRRRAPVRARVHVVPPEHLGAGERRVARFRGIPDLFARHQAVGLPPQPHFGQVAEVPAVRHDAVTARREPGDERRLHRARDRGEHRAKRARRAARREPLQVRRVLAEQGGRQAHGEDDERRAHAA
jgi:hypothetical protein